MEGDALDPVGLALELRVANGIYVSVSLARSLTQSRRPRQVPAPDLYKERTFVSICMVTEGVVAVCLRPPPLRFYSFASLVGPPCAARGRAKVGCPASALSVRRR